MKTVALAQARSHFKEMIDAAAKGEVIQITRNGKPVAELRAPLVADYEYWKTRKPLNIGKGGLSSLLQEERDQSR